MMSRRVRTVVRVPLIVVGVALVLIEELIWAWMGGLMAQLSRWGPAARVEAAITRLPPVFALMLFILPWAVILPVKLAGFCLIATGKVLEGAVLFVGGELLSMALLARLYSLCRPALRQWAWFTVGERIVARWSRWAHHLLDSLSGYRRFEQGLRCLVATARTRLYKMATRFFRFLRLARRFVKTPGTKGMPSVS